MTTPRITVVEPTVCALVSRVAPVGGLAEVIPGAFEVVYKFVNEHKLQGGANVIIYGSDTNGRIELSCGVQLAQKFESQGEVRCGSTPAGQAVTSTHEGPYDKLHESHEALQAWAQSSQIKLASLSWEVYGPWSDDPSALRTELFHLIAA